MEKKKQSPRLHVYLIVRMLIILLAVYAITLVLGFATTTAHESKEQTEDMNDYAVYILDQLESIQMHDTEFFELMDSTGLAESTLITDSEIISELALADLLNGLREEKQGLFVISYDDGTLLLTNAKRFSGCEKLSDCFDSNTIDAINKSVATGEAQRVPYSGAATEQTTGNKAQDGFLVAQERAGFIVTLLRTHDAVFADRTEIMALVALSILVMLGVVFLLVYHLVNGAVVRRIQRVDGKLAQISEGKLDTVIDAAGTREMELLSAGINQTVDTLKGYITEAETRIDAELATARAIQESALPRTFPPFPHIPQLDIFACMHPAREVGGDFYDFFLLSSDSGAGRLAFVIADVSDKGIPAALFMMKAKTLLRDSLESGKGLGDAMAHANHILCDGNDEDMFVTAWVGILDYTNASLTCVNAGHCYPLLKNADGSWTWIRRKSGLPLGMLDGMSYQEHTVVIHRNAMLLLYTDGVTEAMDADDAEYGEARLQATVEKNGALPSHELIDAIHRDVLKHAAGTEQSDDITILCIGLRPGYERLR